MSKDDKQEKPTKYIFVTGGVVSSLGKGLAAASLGTLLEYRGLKVVLQKFDPYLNVDPGTMSPFQHGEVYVLDDGAETDLDLGHYERFTSGNLTKNNNLTSGQVYEMVLEQERRGDYLGATVQVIPHVTDEIKNRIYNVAKEQKPDIIITEIGGTIGDIEGLPFLEAMRQFALENGKDNVLFIHVTLLPFLAAAGELKTKPTQQSVAKLQSLGIQPDIIICRTEHEIEDDMRHKISMFCNVAQHAVIQARDMEHSIYELPLELRKERLDRIACDSLRLTTPTPDLTPWENFVQGSSAPHTKSRLLWLGNTLSCKTPTRVSTKRSPMRGLTSTVVLRFSGSMQRTSRSMELRLISVASVAFSFPEDSEIEVSRARSKPRASLAKPSCLTLVSVLACKSPRSNTRAMSAVLKVPTAKSLTRRPNTWSSVC